MPAMGSLAAGPQFGRATGLCGDWEGVVIVGEIEVVRSFPE